MMPVTSVRRLLADAFHTSAKVYPASPDLVGRLRMPFATATGSSPCSLPLLAILILSLSGCVTTPVAQKVYIPVPTPCIARDKLPALPKASTDADLAKLPDGDLVLQLAADRIEYRRHSTEASAVLEACVD